MKLHEYEEFDVINVNGHKIYTLFLKEGTQNGQYYQQRFTL